MNKKVKAGDSVEIGDPLGVVEEYLPDKFSAYAKDGIIYATKSGKVNIDLNRKKISVKGENQKHVPALKIGDVIIGIVTFVRKYSVGITIEVVNNRVMFNSNFFGNVHVSQISNSYIEKVEDGFQKTDIIRARVTKLKYNEIDMSTDSKNLGVVAADCPFCGTTLEKIKNNLLKCPLCQSMEKRKLADDYDSIDTRLIL